MSCFSQLQKKSPAPLKRLHHKNKRCPIENCEFNGADLQRHLTVHVKRGDVDEASVDRSLSIVAAEGQKEDRTGSERGSYPQKENGSSGALFLTAIN